MKAQRSKVFKPVMLALAVSGLMYGLPTQRQAFANDLDIYRPAVEGKTTLVLMLDTSGSMGSDQVGASACDLPAGVTASSTNNTRTSTTTPAYTIRFCRDSTGAEYLDRLSRLKEAMFALMDDPTVDSKIVMGLAQFSSQSTSANVTTGADSISGKIVLPAKPLDSTQRLAIKQAVANLIASGGTPTAQAYAEAAAYLLGTNTLIDQVVRKDVYRAFRDSSNRIRYNLCSVSNAIDPVNLRQTCRTWNTTALTAQPSITFDTTYTSGSFTVYADNINSSESSGFSRSVAASKSGLNYISPLPTEKEGQECNGQGIYFLSDGEPNTENTRAVDLMRSALKDNNFGTAGGLPNNGALSNPAWPATGSFAKFLFDKTKNPAAVEIKTAVVGYGRVFAGITKTTRKDPKTNKDREYYNCNLATNDDAKNACNWGEKAHPNVAGVGGFGQGGFYYASSPADVVASVKSFLAELKTDIPAVPAGAVVVPQDTLAPDSLSPFAYLPLLQPEPGKTRVAWAGNLKKYDVKEGTVFGANSKLVFDDKGQFATDTYDLWAVTKDAEGKKVPDGGLVTAGGAYANLPVPTKTNSLDRNVWLQSGSTTSIPSTELRRVRPTITDMNALPGLTNLQRRYLLNFLGYDIPEVANSLVPSSLLDPANILPTTLVRPDESLRVMGGVVHSTPQMLTYSADLKEDGSLSDQRDESLLFGSFEGALHVINADTGVEQMAFIPREILEKQPRALKPATEGSLLATSQVAPTPTAFGVDAPWAAYAEYARTGDKIKATSMYAYGGLRLGGNSFYGLNIIDRTAPKLMFALTPTKTGFSRLGHAWGKPVITRVRFEDKIRTVVIVSGGYDMDYEKLDKDRNTTTDVKGNAIYMLDAKTGELLLSVGKNATETPSVAGSATLLNANIRYSIVSRVKTLDRDADGLTDHLYFADLGGQLFRVDLQNAPKTTKVKFGQRVVRLADLTTANGVGKPGPRFYEAPIVTLHDEGSRRFAVVNIGSGDRSNPLDITPTVPNRIYGVIDRDVARQDLYSANITMRSENIQLNDAGSVKGLIEKPNTPAHKAAMLSDGADRKNGWYYPLNEYSQNTNLPGLKAFNEGVAIRNDLYMSVYNPSVVNNGANPCSAQVLGGTEMHRYCLPFGICAADDPIQRFNLGQGIQTPIIGPDDESKSGGQTRRLIYQRKTADVKDEVTGQSAGQHRKYPTPPRLVPVRWHEKQPKLPD